MVETKKKMEIATLIKASVLGVIAFVLMLIEFVIPVFPTFLKMDFSDIPAIIGGFSLGPTVGIFIEFIKILLKVMFVGTHTGMVGELSNFVIGSFFAFTAGFIYKKNKTKAFAILSLVLGTLVMSAIGALSNYYVMLPLYSKFMPMKEIIEMASKLNSYVVDAKTLVLFAIVPFNLLKGFFVSIITMLIYKRISPILKKDLTK